MIHTLTEKALTVFGPTGVLTVHSDDTRFEEACEYMREDDLDGLIDLLKPIERIRAYLSDNGRVEIKNNQVFLDGDVVDNYMGERILAHFREGNPVEPIINFMVNVASNPSKRAVDELLGFLEYGDLPITPDGCFLAYKKVGDGYLDCWSRKIDNSIGSLVSMPRNQVQDDPNVTCSYGLHFCSLEYVRSFGGSHLMVLKINPRDVVSIPTDYNNTKGRCCRYEVVGELEDTPTNKNHWGKALVTEYEPEPEVPEDEDVVIIVGFTDGTDDDDNNMDWASFWDLEED